MTENQQQAKQGKKYNFIRALIVAMVLGVFFLGGHYGIDLVNQQLDAIQSQTSTCLTEQKYLAVKQGQLQKTVDELQNNLEKSSFAKDDEWQLILVRHLVEMAKLSLQTVGDVKLAISYLEAASRYVVNIQELFIVKSALNKDIKTLSALLTVDIDKIIIKITKLEQNLVSLPLVMKNFVKVEDAGNSEDKKTLNYVWNNILTNLTLALKNILIIRHKRTEPLLLPDQEEILRLNLQTKFTQLELTVMQRQNEQYHVYLQGIEDLINKYFILNRDIKNKVQATIDELKKINLESKEISLSSWEAVRSLMNNSVIQKKIAQTDDGKQEQAKKSEGAN